MDLTVILPYSRDPREVESRASELQEMNLDGVTIQALHLSGEHKFSETLSRELLSRLDLPLIAVLLPGWSWHPDFVDTVRGSFEKGDGLAAVCVCTKLPSGKILSGAFPPLGRGAPLGLANNLSALCFSRSALLALSPKVWDFDGLFCQELVQQLSEHFKCAQIPLALAHCRSPTTRISWREWHEYVSKKNLADREKANELLLSLSSWELSRRLRLYRDVCIFRSEWRKLKRRYREWPVLWAFTTLLGWSTSKARGNNESFAEFPCSGNLSCDQGVAVVSVFLSRGRCAQRGTHLEPRYEVFAEWCESLYRTGTQGYLLHDGLPNELHLRLASAGVVLLEKVPVNEIESPTVQRFRLYLDFLEEHPNIEFLFFTDLTDLAVVRELCFEQDNRFLYLGSEETKIGESAYMWKTALEALKWKDRFRFLRLINRKLLNCGIIGGEREMLLKLLQEINQELDRSLPESNSDMVCFNLAVYGNFRDEEIVTGFPLHSRFGDYEVGRDFIFRHK